MAVKGLEQFGVFSIFKIVIHLSFVIHILPAKCQLLSSTHYPVIDFSDLVDLWVIRIKKVYDPLRT